MKKIIISDEQYEFLKDLQQKMINQNNRGTADPYYFQVIEDEKIYVGDLSGDGCEIYDNENHEVSFDREDVNGMREYIKEFLEENPKYSISYKELEEIEIDDVEYKFLQEYCGFIEIGYQIFYKYSNFFFTEYACEQNIQLNKHNYNNPRSYVSYGYRNPELENVIKILKTMKFEE